MEMVRAFLDNIAVAFDLPILDWIQANLQSPLMDKLMPIITVLGDAGIFWMVLSVLFLLIPKTRRMGFAMAIAMVMGLIVCNVTLKPLVGRIRPYDLQEQLGVTVKLLIDAQHDFSFPSGHTIASFEASVVILKNNKLLGIPALILAIAIAFSRLYLYVHYPTDVIVSIILGTVFALLADALVKKIPVRKRGKYEA